MAHYPLDGNGNDTSGNALNGTALSFFSTADRFGAVPGALSFSGGSSVIAVADNALLRYASNAAFSVAFWVHFADLANGNTPLERFGGSTYSFIWGFYTEPSTGKLHLGLGRAGFSGDTLVASLAPLDVNTWYFVVGTYDGSIARLYLNGSLQGESTWQGGLALPDFGVPLRFGNLRGQLDDVSIYWMALPASRIASMYSPAPTSGHAVAGVVGGAARYHVTVELSGATTATVLTDVSGNYRFPNLRDGTYTVTPSLTGYVFTPSSQTVTVNAADATLQAFTATAAPPAAVWSIGGTVSGAVASGVLISLTGQRTSSTTTSSTGAYSFTGLPDGKYTVTPTLAGYTFSPTSLAVTVSETNRIGQNFIAITATSDPRGVAGHWIAVTSAHTECTGHAVAEWQWSFDIPATNASQGGSWIANGSKYSFEVSSCRWWVERLTPDYCGLQTVIPPTTLRNGTGSGTGYYIFYDGDTYACVCFGTASWTATRQ